MEDRFYVPYLSLPFRSSPDLVPPTDGDATGSCLRCSSWNSRWSEWSGSFQAGVMGRLDHDDEVAHFLVFSIVGLAALLRWKPFWLVVAVLRFRGIHRGHAARAPRP